jgi:hypothetical protein
MRFFGLRRLEEYPLLLTLNSSSLFGLFNESRARNPWKTVHSKGTSPVRAMHRASVHDYNVFNYKKQIRKGKDIMTTGILNPLKRLSNARGTRPVP